MSIISTTRTCGLPEDGPLVSITTNDDGNGSHESLRIKVDMVGHGSIRMLESSDQVVEFAIDGAYEGQAIIDNFKGILKHD